MRCQATEGGCFMEWEGVEARKFWGLTFAGWKGCGVLWPEDVKAG